MKHPIEVRDPAVDTDAVMVRLQTKMRERYVMGKHMSELPDFELPAVPEVQDATLRYHLERANATYDHVWVDLSLAPSIATQLPIVGKLWRLIREQAHRLILYYVDMAVSKQVGFNEHVVGAVNRLAAAQQEIAMLRQEVAELRQQLQEKDSQG